MRVPMISGSDTFEGGNFRSTDYTAPSEERDYWGGAEKCQLFLSSELLPRIENDYRSDSSQRVIFGQSIGGQFVLYTALTESNLFWGHIASNPALHRNLPFFLQQHGKPDPLKVALPPVRRRRYVERRPISRTGIALGRSLVPSREQSLGLHGDRSRWPQSHVCAARVFPARTAMVVFQPLRNFATRDEIYYAATHNNGNSLRPIGRFSNK